MKRTNVYIAEDDLEALKEAAGRLGVSEAELIRRGIGMAVASTKTWEAPAVRRRFKGSGKTVTKADVRAAMAGDDVEQPSRDDAEQALLASAPPPPAAEQHESACYTHFRPSNVKGWEALMRRSRLVLGDSNRFAMKVGCLMDEEGMSARAATLRALRRGGDADHRAALNIAQALHWIERREESHPDTAMRWVFTTMLLTAWPSEKLENTPTTDIDEAIRLILDEAQEEKQQ